VRENVIRPVHTENVNLIARRCVSLARRTLKGGYGGFDAVIAWQHGAQSTYVQRFLDIWRDTAQFEVARRPAETQQQTNQNPQACAVRERDVVQIEDEVAIDDLQITDLLIQCRRLGTFDDASAAFDDSNLTDCSLIH